VAVGVELWPQWSYSMKQAEHQLRQLTGAGLGKRCQTRLGGGVEKRQRTLSAQAQKANVKKLHQQVEGSASAQLQGAEGPEAGAFVMPSTGAPVMADAHGAIALRHRLRLTQVGDERQYPSRRTGST
jgi:hypothetical protein